MRAGLEALEQARSGASPAAAWSACAELFNGAWDARRAAIEALCTPKLGVTGWRSFSGVDAETIHAERALYARVRSALPAGLTLE